MSRSQLKLFALLTHIIKMYLKYTCSYSHWKAILSVCPSTDIKFFKKFPTIGQNLTYYCTFNNDTPIEIFICKGEDPSICQHLVTSTQPDNTGKFSMRRSEFKGQRSKTNFNLTITVREVTANDSGTYWCGAESKDKTRSNVFFHIFLMTVGKLCFFIVWMFCHAGSGCRRRSWSKLLRMLHGRKNILKEVVWY